jgi:hypothetical protein
MQPNEGFYRQWQLPSKEKETQQERAHLEQTTSALNINALLNQEPMQQHPSEFENATKSLPSATTSEASPPLVPSLKTNLQMTQSPTTESPTTMFSFHQYDPQAPPEATVKRLPLRKRLTLETKVQQQQQIFQNLQSAVSPLSIEQDVLTSTSTSGPPTAATATATAIAPAPAPAPASAPASASASEVPAATSQTHLEPPLDGDTTETDEEKSSVQLYQPVAVQEPTSATPQTTVKMKPLKKTKAWSSTESSQPQLQSNFASMQSQFQLSDTSSPASDIGVKREIPIDTVASANKRPKPTSESPPMDNMKGPASSDMLYCICRKPYDKPRFMIACDECDQWFHGECVGMSERDGGLIELYYCPTCARGKLLWYVG